MIAKDQTSFTEMEWSTLQRSVLHSIDWIVGSTEDDEIIKVLRYFWRTRFRRDPLGLSVMTSLVDDDDVIGRIRRPPQGVQLDSDGETAASTLLAARNIVARKADDLTARRFVSHIVTCGLEASKHLGRDNEVPQLERNHRLQRLIARSFETAEWRALQHLILETLVVASCIEDATNDQVREILANAAEPDSVLPLMVETYADHLYQSVVATVLTELSTVWEELPRSRYESTFEEKIGIAQAILNRSLDESGTLRFMRVLRTVAAHVAVTSANETAGARRLVALALLEQHSFAEDDWLALVLAYLRALSEVDGDSGILGLIDRELGRKHGELLHAAVVISAKRIGEQLIEKLGTEVQSLDEMVENATTVVEANYDRDAAASYRRYLLSFRK